MKKAIAASVLATLALSFSAPARAIEPLTDGAKDSMFYAVMAHPDDEQAGWNVVRAHANDYIVFVTMTMGEGTYNCRTAEEAAEDGGQGGPYSYQGPDSPVNETDLKERHPLGTPWVGQHSEACKRARIASWHWFLDDAYQLDAAKAVLRDPAGADMGVVEDPWDDDDYQGRFCPEGDGHPSPQHTIHPGADPKDKHGQPMLWDPSLGCFDVWANEDGARIALDLGNGDPNFDYNGGTSVEDWPPATYDQADVGAALAEIRERRAEWGLPVLEENGMLAALFYDPVNARGCDSLPPHAQKALTYDHPDHKVVSKALRYDDHGAGPQFGPILCSAEPLAEGAELEVYPTDPVTLVELNNIDFTTNDRLGPGPVNYGWLFERDIYGWAKSPDVFWKVFD